MYALILIALLLLFQKEASRYFEPKGLSRNCTFRVVVSFVPSLSLGHIFSFVSPTGLRSNQVCVSVWGEVAGNLPLSQARKERIREKKFTLFTNPLFYCTLPLTFRLLAISVIVRKKVRVPTSRKFFGSRTTAGKTFNNLYTI